MKHNTISLGKLKDLLNDLPSNYKVLIDTGDIGGIYTDIKTKTILISSKKD